MCPCISNGWVSTLNPDIILLTLNPAPVRLTAPSVILKEPASILTPPKQDSRSPISCRFIARPETLRLSRLIPPRNARIPKGSRVPQTDFILKLSSPRVHRTLLAQKCLSNGENTALPTVNTEALFLPRVNLSNKAGPRDEFRPKYKT
jgi:hypothetical protein